MEEQPPSTLDPIIDLLQTYRDLNPRTITTLNEQPSALEFMRYVHLNRPFVIRKGAEDWKAVREWDVKGLKALVGEGVVQVAVTPLGNADSPLIDKNGELIFVKPCEEQQPFNELIDFISSQELSGAKLQDVSAVRYAQTQNDNLRNEYSTLFSHVEKDIPWARLALQQSPEAINLWIGNSLSTTALHRDNYENVYVQIIGRKEFVLLPPVACACVNERELGSGVYRRRDEGGDDGVGNGNGRWEVVREEGDAVPFATWDPDLPEVNATRYSSFVEPVRVTLEEGDMLYLPALWYHKVSQSCSDEGICCAVNYWYDMEFGGAFYPLCNFSRNVALNALKT